jgi:hypothetical protein
MVVSGKGVVALQLEHFVVPPQLPGGPSTVIKALWPRPIRLLALVDDAKLQAGAIK